MTRPDHARRIVRRQRLAELLSELVGVPVGWFWLAWYDWRNRSHKED